MKIWYTKGLSNTAHAMRLLREAYGERVTLVASHIREEAPVRHAADQFIVEPEDGPGYADWVLQKAQELDVDLVVAQRNPADFWDLRDAFDQAGICLHLPAAPKALRLINRKDLFGMELEQLGLPSPSFEVFKTIEEFDEAAEMMRREGLAPDGLCVKPVTGIYGSGFRELCDAGSDMERLLSNAFYQVSTRLFRQMLAEAPLREEMMLMRFLPGVERSVDFLSRDGEMVAGVARVKRAVGQVIEVEGEALELAYSLAREFNLNGICNMQTREGSDGKQYILEINPRMSGGMQMACRAGINLPAWDVALAMNLRPAEQIPLAFDGVIVGVEETPVLRGSTLAAE